MGYDEAKQRWVEYKRGTLVEGVKRLPVFERIFPHKAYDILVMLL